MKSVLIISYHALPMDVVSSYRAKGYCDYLQSEKIKPTLVTHRWEVDEFGKWKTHTAFDEVLKEEHVTHNVIRLPRPSASTFRSHLKVGSVIAFLMGNLELELDSSYRVFKKFLFEHLKTNHYDCVIGIFSPHYHLRLAYEINQKFAIPYVLDFRDLWNNDIVTKSYHPSLKDRFINAVIKFYWKKWLSNALFFTTTSQIWTDYIGNISKKEGVIIRNGHELEVQSSDIKQEVFKLVFFGRAYPNSNLKVLIEAFKIFLSSEKDKPILIEFVGLKKTGVFNPRQILEDSLPLRNLSFLEYMNKVDLIEYCHKEAALFFLPNFNENNGQFVVKLYDYLALAKPVIIAPKNGSDLETVLDEVQGGISSSSVPEIVDYLRKQYNYFCIHGKVDYNVQKEAIEKYHRKHHVKLLADKLKQAIN